MFGLFFASSQTYVSSNSTPLLCLFFLKKVNEAVTERGRGGVRAACTVSGREADVVIIIES